MTGCISEVTVYSPGKRAREKADPTVNALARLAALRPAAPAKLPASRCVEGSRVYFRGDNANDEGAATVTKIVNRDMVLAFDDGRPSSQAPIALLDTPRWVLTA